MRSATLQSTTGGDPVRLQLDRGSNGARQLYAVHIGERQVEVEQLDDAACAGCLRIHNRVVRYFALRDEQKIDLWLDGDVYSFELIDDTARRSGVTAGAQAKEQLVAPMPGTILKVEVSEGDTFQAHQPLIIMESMKMETTLSMPHAGRVLSVACKTGELVEMGAVLAKVESLDEDAAS